MSRKNLRSLRSARTTGRSATSNDADNEVRVMTQLLGSRLLDPGALRTDGDTQPRTQMQDGLAEEYSGKMRFDPRLERVVDDRDQVWPELLVYEDDAGELWLADGFHRASAAQLAGLTAFQARVERGTQRDAILRSLGVNAEHGARRTRADIRRAVERALLDPVWGSYANNWLAKICRVSAPTVARYRRDLESRGAISFHTILSTEDGREIEREVRPPAPKPAAARRAPRPSRPKASAAWGAGLEVKEPQPWVVAHPRTQEEFEVLAKRAPDALRPDGALLVPCASGDPMLYAGLKALSEGDDAPFAIPHVVYIEGVARMYMIYPRAGSARTWPVCVASVDALVGEETPVVIGAALHAW